MNRRRFLFSLIALPFAPIIGSFAFADKERKVTREDLNNRIQQLAITAGRVPIPEIFTALLITSAAIEHHAECSLAADLVKWSIPEEGGAQ